MKREIKFKIWNNTEKSFEIIEFFISAKTGLCHYILNGELVDCGEEEPIILQFTGLKDKNDKEIYEGDKIKRHDGRELFVCWDNKAGKWMAKNDKDYNSSLSFTLRSGLEVTGNIHETK